MSQIKQANELARSGKILEALQIYEELSKLDSPIARIAKFNLDFYRKSTPTRSATESKSIKTSLREVYSKIENEIDIKSIIKDLNDPPLVTIAMTAHNTEAYVETSIESLLQQNYPKLEIIVVDDHSTDKTPLILNRLAASNKTIRKFRLNTNLGTYYAKNLAIQESKGEFVFFQDSDDICHPYRVAVLTHQLLKEQKSIARGAYCRVDADSGAILEVNGHFSKLGLVTLGIRKEVFHQIGAFNTTTKASDDEFFNRAKRLIGKEQITDNSTPLYFNTFRENSLISDMVSLTPEGNLIQSPSESRKKYVEKYTQLHNELTKDASQKIFYFPRLRDAIEVEPDMTKLTNPVDKVVISLCSIPSREKSLQKTIDSIKDQCDEIHVYLDGYTKTPNFLEALSDKCVVTRSQDRPHLRDNGKFIALEAIVNSREDSYYLTVDDDIIYPPDYAHALIRKIDEYNKLCAVGVHGVTLKKNPAGYFSDRRTVFSFNKELESDRLVNILGTGTFGVHTSIFKSFTLATFEKSGMADIYMAVLCKQLGIPQVCLARHSGWLIDLNPTPTTTLYSEFKNNDKSQSELITRSGPWGMLGMMHTINELGKSDHATYLKLKELVPSISLTPFIQHQNGTQLTI